MIRLTATVHGYVQGVSFRYYTQLTANKLGVVGYARNQPDRTVFVVAEGEEEQVQALARWLEKGSPAARVSRVEKDFSTATGEFRHFQIRL